MINYIHFKNFKAFTDFTIYIKEFNVLTGPNNAGKSTIIDGLRILQAAHRYASRYNPKLIDLPFGFPDSWGYEIPEASIPIQLTNIQTNFNTQEPSLIRYRFRDGQSLTILMHPDHKTYFVLDTPRAIPKTATTFRKEFKLNLSIVPTLGPFDIEEELYELDYIKRFYGSRRSPRMFRSYWFHTPEFFEQFSELLEKTWPGITISRPEKKHFLSKELMILCYEDREPREICWVGFGLQIWLQLLTHIVHSRDADIVVVDEPEVYLHPDLQHKILEILSDLNASIILSTHSVEIINNVEPSDVLLIDKTNKFAKRISDLEGLQNVANLLGSSQNIQLTKLARGKKILFVEGKDLKLLVRLAKVCGYESVFKIGALTVIPIEGFSHHDRIVYTNWAFSKVLGEEIRIAALLDKDFRTEDDIQIVKEKIEKDILLLHILSKKEIENYFIIPSAIQKAIYQRLKEREQYDNSMPTIEVYSILEDITDLLKTETLSQLAAHKIKPIQKTGKDISTIFIEFAQEFENNWKSMRYRYDVISGKVFFSTLNEYLQKSYKITISYAQVANNIKASELDPDLKFFFKNLATFVNTR